jgi:hypothetical protein
MATREDPVGSSQVLARMLDIFLNTPSMRLGQEATPAELGSSWRILLQNSADLECLAQL